jgi:hypothetical protein
MCDFSEVLQANTDTKFVTKADHGNYYFLL